MYYSEQDHINKIIETLKLGGYIKGHGKDRYRLMTSDHEPVFNFGKDYFDSISHMVSLIGLAYFLNQ